MPPLDCESNSARLQACRLELLSTRGLFVLRVRAPAAPDQETFNWIRPPPDPMPQDVKVFIDGSLFDESLRWARRTGFGVAIVSHDGSLLAFGNGIPPRWIIDAAGAELWAFYIVASIFPFLPRIVTDCKGILEGLERTPQHVCGRSKALARTWKMVAHVLDGDFRSARSMVAWMPAHTSLASIGQATDSEGGAVDAIMWRANRLVDVLAKAAAAKYRLPAPAVKHVKDASKLYLHHMARLGKATYDANHFRVVDTNCNGSEASRIVRDSTAARPSKRNSGRAPVAGHDAVEASGLSASGAAVFSNGGQIASRPRRPRGNCRCTSAPPTAQAARSRKLAIQTTIHQLKADADEEVAVSRWVAALDLRPRLGATAEERLDALRARVRERARKAEES